MNIDRTECRKLRQALEAHLESFEYEGVTASIEGSARYSDTTASFKLEVTVNNADGSTNTKAAEDFKRHAPLYGMKESDLGRTFRHGRDLMEVVGFRPRARKNNVIVRNQNGKEYVMPHTTVVMYLKDAA